MREDVRTHRDAVPHTTLRLHSPESMGVDGGVADDGSDPAVLR